MIIVLPAMASVVQPRAPQVIQPDLQYFPNGEVLVQVPPMQGAVAVVATCAPPVAASLLEIFSTLDAVRQAGAERVTVLLSYIAHARDGTMARLTCRLLWAAGADHIVVVDPHTETDMPWEALTTTDLFAADIRTRFQERDIVIVSPDAGGAARASRLAAALEVPVLVLSKKRFEDGPVVSCVPQAAPLMTDKICVLVDDLVDSGKTLVAAAEVLKDGGAAAIHAYVTHGVLQPGALARLEASLLTSLVITDSLPWVEKGPFIEKISLKIMINNSLDKYSNK